MKRFLLKTSIYIIAVIGLLIFLGSFADGNVDDNYRHFTQKSENIILGDSRGSQAMVCDILDKKIKVKKFDNFALNISQTPYGWVYLKGLKRKLKEGTKDGIFILTVDPWNVSLDKNIKSLEGITENNSPLDNMCFYDIHPNYEYLIKNYNKTWYYIYRDREEQGRSASYAHQNGWLEVNIDISPSKVAEREKGKIEFYNEFATTQRISNERLAAFVKIIEFLQNHGEVYIVRIPPSYGLLKIENKYAPHFNRIMDSISTKYKVPYFDFAPNATKYIYTDGNHMYKESGKIFTAQVADSILEYKRLRK